MPAPPEEIFTGPRTTLPPSISHACCDSRSTHDRARDRAGRAVDQRLRVRPQRGGRPRVGDGVPREQAAGHRHDPHEDGDRPPPAPTGPHMVSPNRALVAPSGATRVRRGGCGPRSGQAVRSRHRRSPGVGRWAGADGGRLRPMSRAGPAVCTTGWPTAQCPRRRSHSSSVNSRERIRNRTPSGASTENPLPRPFTTSTVRWVWLPVLVLRRRHPEPDRLLQPVDPQVAEVDVRVAGLEVAVRVAHRRAPVAASAGLVEHQRPVDRLSA